MRTESHKSLSVAINANCKTANLRRTFTRETSFSAKAFARAQKLWAGADSAASGMPLSGNNTGRYWKYTCYVHYLNAADERLLSTWISEKMRFFIFRFDGALDFYERAQSRLISVYGACKIEIGRWWWIYGCAWTCCFWYILDFHLVLFKLCHVLLF